jgi:hypothetical protein
LNAGSWVSRATWVWREARAQVKHNKNKSGKIAENGERGED